MTGRVRRLVRCAACEWKGQRALGTELDTPCPRCGGYNVWVTTRAPGGSPKPAAERRVRITVRVLESTARELGTEPARLAALLDGIAESRSTDM